MRDVDKQAQNCARHCKEIFFDVGFTLVDETKCWQARCEEQANSNEARALYITAADVYDALQNACRSNLQNLGSVARQLGFTQIAPYRKKYEKLYPAAETVLAQLSRNYKLGVIANQSKGLRDRLTHFGILRFFDYVISSAYCGASKPDPSIIQIALRKANCSAAEAVMIGDRIDNDVVPAKLVGMKTVWIKQGLGGLNVVRNESERPDCEVNNLTELLRLFTD